MLLGKLSSSSLPSWEGEGMCTKKLMQVCEKEEETLQEEF